MSEVPAAASTAAVVPTIDPVEPSATAAHSATSTGSAHRAAVSPTGWGSHAPTVATIHASHAQATSPRAVPTVPPMVDNVPGTSGGTSNSRRAVHGNAVTGCTCTREAYGRSSRDG